MVLQLAIRQGGELMLSHLPNNLQCHIQEYVLDYTKYWKHRFTQDVLSCIDKGFRLISTYTINDMDGVCLKCYHYGIGRFCGYCSVENNILTFGSAVISFEEYCIRKFGQLTPSAMASLKVYEDLQKRNDRLRLGTTLRFNIHHFGINWWKKK